MEDWSLPEGSQFPPSVTQILKMMSHSESALPSSEERLHLPLCDFYYFIATQISTQVFKLLETWSLLPVADKSLIEKDFFSPC